MLIDAILFGVVIQLYIKWHTYSRKEDRKIVRGLVVSCSLSPLTHFNSPDAVTPESGYATRWKDGED